MFHGSNLGYTNESQPGQEVARKDFAYQDVSDISLDISQFAKHLEARNGQGDSLEGENRTQGGLFDFGFNGDFSSPPSPAT